MTFGLIGAGRWAEVHRRALAEVGAELVGVLVSSEASRTRVQRDWKVSAATELDTFLSWDADAVIVVSPNYLHARHSIAALDAGKHVLVEKPMATELDDCQRTLEAAKASGRVLAVGLEMRVFTLFAKIKELIASDAIGRPLHLKLDLWRRPYRGGAGGWKADPARLGNAILEEPIHYLDLARWYLGEPTALEAWANSRSGRGYLHENLDIRIEFAGGAQALVTRSVAAFGHHVSLQLVGERGSLRAVWNGVKDIDPSPSVGLWLHTGSDRDAPAERLEVPSRTGHAYDVPLQTAAFIIAVQQGSRPPATGEDGLAAVALCLAVERSLSSGERVTLP